MSDCERVLFVVSEFTYGGTALLVTRHLRRLTSSFAIDLLITGPAAPEMLCELPASVSAFYFRPAHRRFAARIWLAREPLAAGIVLPRHDPPFQRRYRAVFTALGLIDWRACMVFRQLPAPRKFLFLTDNSLGQHAHYRPRERAAIECCVLAADCVLPVSHALWLELAEKFPPLAERPFRILRPPVDVPPAEPAARSPYEPRTGPVVLTIARLLPGKNLGACIRIHARLCDEGVNFRWYVIGTGEQEGALRAEISRLGLSDHFFLVGRQASIAPWLEHCDVFALFSEREGCPTVVLEALRARCPVVTTDVNGVKEVIDHEHTGLILGHDDDSLAAGLGRLLRDETLRRTFRRNLAMNASSFESADSPSPLLPLIQGTYPSPSPRVSILIPTYNQAAVVERAIASALMQDVGNLEVIVSDDASTDDTGERARAWESDPRFHYHRNPVRLGHVANYRRALCEHARGDWVLMLDGDDYLIDPAFLRTALRAIEREGTRRVVFAQAGHRVLPTGRDLRPPIDQPTQLVSGGEYLRLVYASGFFTHLGALYDRQAAIRHGFYTAPIASSDMDSLLRLALEGDVLLLNTIAGCWVHHGANLSQNLPLDAVPANVRIFRSIAATAVRRGLISASRMEGVLTHHEAITLAHLCMRSLAKEPPRLRTLFRLTAVVFAVNPRLLLQPAVARVYYNFLCLLTGISPRNRLARRLCRIFSRGSPPAPPPL